MSLPTTGRWLCCAGAAFGALGLVAWLTGASFLALFTRGHPPMMADTALGILLVGLAGALRGAEEQGLGRRLLSLAMVLGVLVIGVGTLAEYALDVDLGIDRLLPYGQSGPHPGRPSPLAALSLTLLAAAVALFDVRPSARARASELLALGGGLTAYVALLGFVFGSGPLYYLPRAPVAGVALPTAVALLLTSAGLLLERPAAGIMGVVTSARSGGVLLRRLAPLGILAPVVLGVAVRRLSAVWGLQDLSLMVAILTSAMTVVGLCLLGFTAARLDRTHEELDSSRQRVRDLLEQASDGLFVADLDGRYTDVNGAGCRMVGYSREELLGKTIADLLVPEDLERLQRVKGQLLAGETDVAEWTARRKDGSTFPVEVSTKILPDGRWQALARDVSERRRLEEELRRSEALFSGIVSISADAIVSIDEDQRITIFNDGAAKIFGYSKAEAIGAPLDILIPERFRASHRLHLERFAAGAEVSRGMGERGAAISGLRKNGEEFPADSAISKLEVGGKTILTAALRDMTERKRIEDEQRMLAEVGAVLASTLDYDQTLTNVGRLAVHNLCDACVVDVLELGGETRRLKLVSRDVQAATAPVRIADVPALIARAPQSAMTVPLVAHGKILGAVTFLATAPPRTYRAADLRLAEELARRAALAIESAGLYRAAGRAVQARDEVLGIVAHDLRNPLGTILMHAGLLRRRGPDPERRSRRPAEAIERAATRMNRLIQDLLDVTSLEAGHLTVERGRVPAGQMIADSVEAQRALATSASVELRLDVPVDLPALWADRDRLLQIFENLIGNAIKFTPPGGRITVGAAPGSGEVLFWVADTGAGIPAEDQPRVFDRFWQAQKGAGGAGLGLPIVKGIVDAHGGRVSLESTPGRGSTFSFTIPTAPVAERWQPEPAPQRP
jgi:PAS domain S-box-containing protein